ncbi:site-specific integrase [Allobaculum sp. JKK-2023]|uniref:tyrosine-type recombinase/integrase n=1 Tax=Allobaculum sp. JKK-2023 TaxID=3108943 RepID=UPI002B059CD5|nr:site-specific integrase [Allobaculum sp. JKK-2023]
MTHSEALALFDQMTEFRNLQKGTRSAYHAWIVRFLNHASPSDVCLLTPFAARDYLIWLKKNSSYAPSTIDGAVFAIRFFYESVLGLSIPSKLMPKALHRNPAPTPGFTHSQINILIDSCTNPLLKAAILLGYDCGLRVSEVVSLRFSDFNKKDALITIHNSKRNKTRSVHYSKMTQEALNDYYKYAFYNHPVTPKPDEFVFQGKKPGRHLSSDSLSQSFKKYIQAFDFYLPSHRFHSLRVSFATHMAKDNCSLFALKEAMGHSSIASTARYIRLDEKDLADFGSPCESWKGKNNGRK